jgi:hypothetical protein
MNIFQLRYAVMVVFLLLLSHSVSFGMQLFRKRSNQQKGLELENTIVQLRRYSLDHMPREMQDPIFRQSGLSFDDKKNLSMVNKASHKNMRKNVLRYHSVSSRGIIFAIDTSMYVADIANNLDRTICSIV